jgi:glycosyltransferase involved in cell wall biosynthesis
MQRDQGPEPQGNDLSIVAIIPIYNGEKYIREAIQSVLDQTLPPDELIVVDDGSKDGSRAIAEEMAALHPQIRILTKENGGQSSARNFGVANSKSALVAFLDQDDGWYPHHLAELVKPFRDRSIHRLGWVYSDLDEHDRDGFLKNRRMLKQRPQIRHPKNHLDECLSDDLFILPSASLIARTAFESVGGYDERLSGYEDDDLFLRLFRAGYTNIHLPKSLSFWRIYTGSTSWSPRMARSRMIYFRKLRDAFPDDPNLGYRPLPGLIAPRFYRYLRSELGRGARIGDPALYDQMIKDIKEVIPYMSLWRRLRVRPFVWAATPYKVGRVFYRLQLPQIYHVLQLAIRGK